MIRRLVLLLCVAVTSSGAVPRRRAVTLVPVTSFSFDFRNGGLGWEAGFSDYNPSTEDMNLTSDIRLLPPEIGADLAFFISGSNRSDDLFMFLRRRLSTADGIRPIQSYIVTYTITFASNAPSGCFGIGGAPGEAVTLKAGAAGIKPEPSLVNDHFQMNIDKGDQSFGGAHASVVGNIANGLPCTAGPHPYVSLLRSHRHHHAVQSSADGDLWLIAGTDSGFEGTTSLYYQRIDVSISPVP